MIRRGDRFFRYNEVVMDRRCFPLRDVQPMIILCGLFKCQGWYGLRLYTVAFGSMCLILFLLAVELWFPFFVWPMMQISLIVLALLWDEVSYIFIDDFIVIVFLWYYSA